MKYNDNGTIKEIPVKASDTLPIGSIVEFDGDTIPSGWEEVENVENVLWTNLNINSEFTSQTITLNDSISNYSYIEIIYANNKEYAYSFNTGKIIAGKNTTMIGYSNLGDSNNIGIRYRDIINFNGKSATVSDCYLKLVNATTRTIDNNLLIPVKIIGYK